MWGQNENLLRHNVFAVFADFTEADDETIRGTFVMQDPLDLK